MVQQTTIPGIVRDIPSKPDDFEGSGPEWTVYVVLQRQGLRPGIDFMHQARMFGGRTELGGLVVDFMFNNPPGLAINVQGVYFHYQQGSQGLARDIIAREVLAQRGITLIFIDEDDLETNPNHYILEALRFRDHSKLSQTGRI